jgi:hypothetical protein
MIQKNEQAIKKIVIEAVHETLSGLGFDVSSRYEMQADLLYLRKARNSNEELSKLVKGAIITLVVPTALCALWQGLKLVLGV